MRKLGNNDKEEIKRYFGSFPEETPVTVEATTGREWLSDLLEEELEIKLANPHKVKLIAEATIKTDKIDATTLAQLERTNFLDVHIDIKEKQIKKIVRKEELAKLLMTIPGTSYFSALLLLSEIGDINRFSSAKKLCSYAGLSPTTRQSNETVYHGHLKKKTLTNT